MKLRTTVLLTAVFSAVTLIQTARAAFTDNLADLVANHGSLTIGDKIFSGFTAQENGLIGYDASQISVTASDVNGVYYLTYVGNMQLFGATAASADLKLGYSVTATGGSIASIDQLYTGGAAGNGSLLINETATSSGAPTVSSQLSAGFVNDHSDPNTYPNGPLTAFDLAEPGDLLTVTPPQTTLNVVKDMAFGIASPGGQVSVSLVQQSFHQVVPEPTTVLAGALLLLPFGASTIRILRRNRLA